MRLLRRAFGFSPETEDEDGDYEAAVPTDAVSDQSEEDGQHEQATEAETEVEQTAVAVCEEVEETEKAVTVDVPVAEDAIESATETAIETMETTTVVETPVADESVTDQDNDLTDDIFDEVIELFNRTQPEFVRECLNIEAQRRYILNSLSENLRQRLHAALSADGSRWSEEKERLEKRIAELEADDNEMLSLRKEKQKLQLSFDYQKRALLERIDELEAQLSHQTNEHDMHHARNNTADPDLLDRANARVRELEAEIETLRARNEVLDKRIAEMDFQIKMLESAAMPVAEQTVVPTTVDPSALQIPTESTSEQTVAEITSVQPVAESVTEKTDADSAPMTELQARIDSIEQLNAALEAEKAALVGERDSLAEELRRLNDEKTDLDSQCNALREEVSRQTTLRDQLEVKTAMSDAMINDLRNQAAAARSELQQMQQEQESVLLQIQEQLDGVEDLKARKDAKIKELQESNASLRRTIETNLYNQANSEMKLRSEIKELKAEIARLNPDGQKEKESTVTYPPVKPYVPAAGTERPPKRRGRPKKARIDSDLDNTDWFAGTPPTKHDDPDFGYHEPPRKPVNDNEAQLTLF